MSHRVMFAVLALLFLSGGTALASPDEGVLKSPLQRVIILTDIENEPDDAQSLIRLLLYSNDLDIRGIIASTSTHMRNRVAPESVLELIDAYAKVYPNLLRHCPSYPTADSLRAMVKAGLPRYGMNGVGKDKDSEGSQWLISELKKADPRPLWVCAWGGTNVLAQALWRIKASMSAREVMALVSRLRVYTISDQDDTGAWLRKTFPELFYITSTGLYDGSTWLGIGATDIPFPDATTSSEWLAENIQQGHGPLGAMYPDVAYTMEGDSPSFLGLIRNGLNDMEHPSWGGWGGRYECYIPEYHEGMEGPFGVPYLPETRPIWTDAEDGLLQYYSGIGQKTYGEPIVFKGNQASLWRWREDFQNDFAARMDWCTKSYEEANHAPVPVVKMYTRVPDRTVDVPGISEIADFTVKSGQPFFLDAAGSSDPDGDSLSYFWFNYPEAGTVKRLLMTECAPNIRQTRFTAPVVDKPEYLHFILKVTDKGTPRLTSYARVIVKVVEK